MFKNNEGSSTIQPSISSKLIMPPHSLDAERIVLGSLMINNKYWDQIAERIVEKHFYRKDHQLIFRAIIKLNNEDQPIDVITVSEVIEKTEGWMQSDVIHYLGELALNAPRVVNIAAYADIILEQALLREIINVGTDMIEEAFNTQGRSSIEILDNAEKKVFEIAEYSVKSSSSIKPLLSKTLDIIEERFSNNSFITGIPTGFTDLDKITSGLQPGELIIVAGRPSMGKTTLAINIAEYTAIKCQKFVLVFSMEMSAESFTTRMLSSLGFIDHHKLRTGRLAEEDWSRLTSACSLLNNAKLHIDTTPALKPMELCSKARRIARESESLGLIVIDYLQLMRGQVHSENRIPEISRSLKALAKELNVPIIALSQLNRNLEQRQNKRPIISDLWGSGAIEQDADLIMFIYRDEVYHEDSPDKGMAEIIIGKQRNGPLGSIRLPFNDKYPRFINLPNFE